MAATIKKAVFPVAGLGTRFLPATKATPKEMLPVVDKPLIQYAVEEAIHAGIKELIFVTNHSKRALEDHFDLNYELESRLEERGHYQLLALVRKILPEDVACVYIRQPKPLGLGHAVLCAKDIVGGEPFAVLLADDLIDEGENGCLVNMVKLYERKKASILGVENVPPNEIEKYGIVGFANDVSQSDKVNQIVEKPAPKDAPSNSGVVGRYILTPQIFSMLENIKFGKNNELQLTDGISALLAHEPIYTYALQGKRYDCGHKLGYMHATVTYAMKDPEINQSFKALLEQTLQDCY